MKIRIVVMTTLLLAVGLGAVHAQPDSAADQIPGAQGWALLRTCNVQPWVYHYSRASRPVRSQQAAYDSGATLTPRLDTALRDVGITVNWGEGMLRGDAIPQRLAFQVWQYSEGAARSVYVQASSSVRGKHGLEERAGRPVQLTERELDQLDNYRCNWEDKE